ncbi:hypothetical protein D3C78_836760 [compost metagenome]
MLELGRDYGVILHIDEGARQVGGEASTLPLVHDAEQIPRLAVVVAVMVAKIVVQGGPFQTQGRFLLLAGLLGAETVRLVVGAGAAIAVRAHCTVTMSAVVEGAARGVDRQQAVVDAEAIALGVTVGEESPLQHAIRREADTGHHVGRGEGRLLHVGEVVVRVLVKLQHADRDQRVVAVRPHLGEVERVDFVGLGLGLRHHLHIDLPAREVAPLDGVVEIRLTGLPILADGGGGLFICVEAVALLCLEVELDPEALVGRVDEAEGVAAVAVHLPQAPGDAAIAEQYGDLMQGFRMA